MMKDVSIYGIGTRYPGSVIGAQSEMQRDGNNNRGWKQKIKGNIRCGGRLGIAEANVLKGKDPGSGDTFKKRERKIDIIIIVVESEVGDGKMERSEYGI